MKYSPAESATRARAGDLREAGASMKCSSRRNCDDPEGTLPYSHDEPQ